MTAEPGSSTTENTVREMLTVARNWADAIVANDATRIREFVTEDW